MCRGGFCCVGWSRRCVPSCLSAHAAPHDACCRRHARQRRCAGAARGVRRRPVRFPVRRRPETAAAGRPAAGQFLRRSVRPQPAARAATAPGRHRRLRTRILRAQLRRPVFPAGARQRDAGADVPGVLPGQPDQGLLRQHHRQRVLRHRRALCRQRKRLSPIARRCAPTAPATAAIPPASRRSI